MLDKDKKKIKDVFHRVRAYCYFLAENSDDIEFELNHMKSVERNAFALADKRGLNKDLAGLIALLHDMGRVKGGVYGRGHAGAGAVEADFILKKHGVRKKFRSIIVKAVSNHNKKKKIHGKYSELIKDADSMSRYAGIPDYKDDSHEFLRNKYARLGKCRITNKRDVDINGILMGKIRELKRDISEIKKGSVTTKLIHEIRIKIRSIRSIIWYIKNNVKSNCRVSFEIIDDDLRSMFKDYETPRKVHVFRKKLRKKFVSGGLMDYLKESRKKEYAEIEKKAMKKHRALIAEIGDRVDFIAPACRIRNASKLPENFRFRSALKRADSSEIASLHRLRILCKKAIYLEEMGIIEFSQQDFKSLLKNLHGNIGLLNDRIENVRMLKKIKKDNPVVFKGIQYREIIDYLNGDSGLSEIVRKDLFELNLRI